MLYLIGLGLGDAKDITINGLEVVKRHELELLYGREILLADREMIEQGCTEILDAAASDKGAAILVVGDPMNATTHNDLLLRATSRNIPYRILHNASIINAVACCGLQIYSFGETVSIPFWTETWKPDSFYDKILRNRRSGLHTLCLLDIKVKEPNIGLLMKGVKANEPPRFMSFSQAAEQIVNIIQRRRLDFGSRGNDSTLEQVSFDQGSSGLKKAITKIKAEEEATKKEEQVTARREMDNVTKKEYDQAEEDLLSEQSIVIGMARVGSNSQAIVRTSLLEAIEQDLGPPLHSLVIPGTLHPLEEEILNISCATQV